MISIDSQQVVFSSIFAENGTFAMVKNVWDAESGDDAAQQRSLTCAWEARLMHPVWMVYLLAWTLEWKAWGNATQCCTCIQFVRHVRLISTLQARVCSHGTRSRKVLWTRCKCQHAYMLTKAMLTCIFYLGLWAPWQWWPSLPGW